MVVNSGKSIGRNFVVGSTRSNCKIAAGLTPGSETHEKLVNGWMTCRKPSSPSALSLDLLPGTRDLERCFHSSVENSACCVAIEVKRCIIRHNKVWDQRIATRSEKRFPDIARLTVVGRAKPGTWDDAQPAKISVWVKELVKSIDPPAFVVVEARTAREIAMKVRNPAFALVKDWTSKNGSPDDVQHYLGKTLGLLEELVSLKARDRGQGINGIRFSYRHDVVRHGIDAEFGLVEILHDESIA